MSVEIDLCAAKLWKLLRFLSLRNDWANKSVSRLFSVFTPHSKYCIHSESFQSWSLQFWVPRECDLIKTVNFLFPTLDVSLLSAFNSLWYSYKDIGTLTIVHFAQNLWNLNYMYLKVYYKSRNILWIYLQ